MAGFVEDTVKIQIIHWGALHETKMQMGNKPIFHIEAFMARVMQIYKKSTEVYN